MISLETIQANKLIRSLIIGGNEHLGSMGYTDHGLAHVGLVADLSRKILTELGYDVEWHTYPMPHSVHPDEVVAIGAFLKKVLVK